MDYFLKKYVKIVIKFKLFAMLEEIHLVLHVANGVLIIIHNDVIVYIHEYKYE